MTFVSRLRFSLAESLLVISSSETFLLSFF